MATGAFKSIGLILGTWVAVIIGFPGIFTCLLIWVVLAGLFLASRFSKQVSFFTEWSWPRFLVTILGALGVPYVYLLLSAGF